MNKGTREFLENIQNEIQEFRKETNNRFDGVEERLENLEAGQEKLEIGQEKLETGQEKLETGQEKLEAGQEKLEAGQEKLEAGQKELKALIEELDPKNANRHLELKKFIYELREDLTNVEIITSSNWNEIAKLKKVK